MKCIDLDPELFFDPSRELEAVAVCQSCPFRMECVSWGAEAEYGVFGGSLPIDRAVERFRALHTGPERDHEFSLILQLCAERGATSSTEIAQMTGIHHRAVALRMGEGQSVDKAAIVELSNQGMSAGKIGLRLGVTKDTVTGVLRRHKRQLAAA